MFNGNNDFPCITLKAMYSKVYLIIDFGGKFVDASSVKASS